MNGNKRFSIIFSFYLFYIHHFDSFGDLLNVFIFLNHSNIMRLDFVDRCRGISIVFMIIAHTSLYWLRPEDKWLFGYIIMFGDFIGASAFIMLSGVAFIFSYYSEQAKLQKDKTYTVREARTTLFTRSTLILVVAILFNGIGTATAMNGPIWWAWFVLQTIAVARFVLYPLIRTKNWIKLLLTAIFFSVADPFKRYLFGQSIHIFTIFYSVPEQNTPFPFWGFFLFGMAFGSYLNNLIKKNESSPRVQMNDAKNMLITGFILSVASIVLWLILHSSDVNIFPVWITRFPEPLYNMPVPMLFFKGTIEWCSLSLGIQLIILALLYRTQILKEMGQNENTKMKDKESKKGLSMLGQHSLTVYGTHFIIFFLLRDSLSYWEFLIVFPLVFLALYSAYWAWINPGKTWITIEWFFKIFTIIAVHYVKPKSNRKPEELKLKLLAFLFEKYRVKNAPIKNHN